VGAQSLDELIDPDIAGDLALSSGGTLKRTLGTVTVRALTDNLDVYFRYGIIVLNDDAVDAAAVPDPWADPANWLYEKSGWISHTNNNDSAQWLRFEIDVKGQRKLPQAARSVVTIMENLSGSASSLEYFQAIKVLVQRS